MPLGPGKYDALCTYVREKSGGKGAIVIVIGDTPEANGVSCQADLRTTLRLPSILRIVADELEEPFRASEGKPAPRSIQGRIDDVLDKLEELLEGQQDVTDGSDGPRPNEAMRLLAALREVRGR
jgi:hypothetical protein